MKQTAQSIINNISHLCFSYMFKPRQSHRQKGIYRGVIVQHIMPQMCACRVKT